MDWEGFCIYCNHAAWVAGILGGVAAVLALFFGPFIWISSKIDSKESILSFKIDSLGSELRSEIHSGFDKLEKKIDELRKEVHGTSDRVIRLETIKEMKEKEAKESEEG